MKQRVALVTGSSRGLGRAIAKYLAAAGVRVAINYAHNKDDAQAALAEVSQVGEAALFRGDVMSESGVRNLVAKVSKELGSIDILVINATPPQPYLSIEQHKDKDFQVMMDAFLMSPHYLTREVMEPMKQSAYGRIIHVTSEVFDEPTANFAAYIGAKGAQTGYLRATAMELAPHGITVNAVAPGWIPLKRHEKMPESSFEAYRQTVPLGRLGTPEEVAATVGFLVSEGAGFITGQTLSVNGGRTIN